MNDKEFGDHLAASPQGDPRNVHQGSISDAREAIKEFKEEHKDEELGINCAICGDALYVGHHQKVAREALPDDADIPEGHMGAEICSDHEGSCLGKLRKGEL